MEVSKNVYFECDLTRQDKNVFLFIYFYSTFDSLLSLWYNKATRSNVFNVTLLIIGDVQI